MKKSKMPFLGKVLVASGIYTKKDIARAKPKKGESMWGGKRL